MVVRGLQASELRFSSWRGRDRTCNLLIQSQAFCRLNYPPKGPPQASPPGLRLSDGLPTLSPMIEQALRHRGHGEHGLAVAVVHHPTGIVSDITVWHFRSLRPASKGPTSACCRSPAPCSSANGPYTLFGDRARKWHWPHQPSPDSVIPRHGIAHQEAPQAYAQEEAQEDAEGHALAAPRGQVGSSPSGACQY